MSYTPDPAPIATPTSRRWRFFDAATGVFVDRVANLPESMLPVNTPAGTVAFEVQPGAAVDILSQRVDIATGELVDYQPPAPAADAWRTWSWDAATKRWVAVPTLAAHKRDARQRMARAWTAAREAGVSIGGKIAPTDAASWTRYLAIKEMAADGGWVDVPIPLADDTFELLTQAKAAALWAALKNMERTLLSQLRDRIQAINAATTPEEVAAVVW